MKKKIFFLGLACALLISGCQKTQSEYEQRMMESKDSDFPIVKEKELEAFMDNEENSIDTKEADGVTRSEFQIMNAKICGMVEVEDHLICVDYENGQLVIVDKKGKVIEKKGKLGSAEGEFQDPTGITKDEKYIYVLDDGNERVQIFDHDLQYVKEVAIDKTDLEPGICLDDIEVDGKQNIYITAMFLDDPGVVVLNGETGKQTLQQVNFCGFLAREKDSIYGLGSGQLYVPAKEPVSFGLGSGTCAFLECFPEESKKLCDMQGENSICDFMIRDGFVYCASQCYNEVQKFAMDGTYIESLGGLNEKSEVEYLCMTENGDIYVSGKSEQIFVFTKSDMNKGE